MTLSDFSIKRPVFAWILMFGLIFFGGIAFLQMGINEKDLERSWRGPTQGNVAESLRSPHPRRCSRSSPTRIALPSSLAYFSAEASGRGAQRLGE